MPCNPLPLHVAFSVPFDSPLLGCIYIYIYERDNFRVYLPLWFPIYIYYINNSNNLNNLNGGLDLNYLNYFLGFK